MSVEKDLKQDTNNLNQSENPSTSSTEITSETFSDDFSAEDIELAQQNYRAQPFSENNLEASSVESTTTDTTNPEVTPQVTESVESPVTESESTSGETNPDEEPSNSETEGFQSFSRDMFNEKNGKVVEKIRTGRSKLYIMKDGRTINKIFYRGKLVETILNVKINGKNESFSLKGDEIYHSDGSSIDEISDPNEIFHDVKEETGQKVELDSDIDSKFKTGKIKGEPSYNGTVYDDEDSSFVVTDLGGGRKQSYSKLDGKIYLQYPGNDGKTGPVYRVSSDGKEYIRVMSIQRENGREVTEIVDYDVNEKFTEGDGRVITQLDGENIKVKDGNETYYKIKGKAYRAIDEQHLVEIKNINDTLQIITSPKIETRNVGDLIKVPTPDERENYKYDSEKGVETFTKDGKEYTVYKNSKVTKVRVPIENDPSENSEEDNDAENIEYDTYYIRDGRLFTDEGETGGLRELLPTSNQLPEIVSTDLGEKLKVPDLSGISDIKEENHIKSFTDNDGTSYILYTDGSLTKVQKDGKAYCKIKSETDGRFHIYVDEEGDGVFKEVANVETEPQVTVQDVASFLNTGDLTKVVDNNGIKIFVPKGDPTKPNDKQDDKRKQVTVFNVNLIQDGQIEKIVELKNGRAFYMLKGDSKIYGNEDGNLVPLINFSPENVSTEKTFSVPNLRSDFFNTEAYRGRGKDFIEGKTYEYKARKYREHDTIPGEEDGDNVDLKVTSLQYKSGDTNQILIMVEYPSGKKDFYYMKDGIFYVLNEKGEHSSSPTGPGTTDPSGPGAARPTTPPSVRDFRVTPRTIPGVS